MQSLYTVASARALLAGSAVARFALAIDAAAFAAAANAR